jgi:hypothetical protein
MPLNVRVYSTFDEFAIAPEDIDWGEAGSSKVTVVQSKAIVEAKFKRLSLTITMRGILETQAEPYIEKAENAALDIISGTAEKRTIRIGGRTIREAVLVRAEPTPTVKIAGNDVIEELVLEYHSQRFV